MRRGRGWYDRHPRPHPATLHSPGHLQFCKEEAEESYLDQFHWINEDGLLTIAVFRRYQNVAFQNRAVLQKPGVDALQGKQGAVMLVVNAKDGSTMARMKLPVLPVWDSLAVASGRLFYTTQKGEVVCLSE